METCCYCQNALPERGFYCPECTRQVRCKNKECRDILEPNAQACITCGTLISADGTGTATNTFPVVSPAVNVLTFDESTKSRALRAHLTDAAVDSLSNALSQFITARLDRRAVPIPPAFVQQERLPGGQQRLFPIPEEPPIQEGKASEPEPVAEAAECASADSEQGRVMRFFRRAGEQLHLDDPRIKASNKLDYARRLTYLFLYAHFLEGRDRVLRSDLYALLTTSTVDDKNTRTWIRKNSSLAKEGELIGLNGAGRDEAKIILNEALDQSQQDDWLPGADRSRSSKANSSDAGAKPASKASGGKGGRPSLVKEWAKKWRGLNPQIDAHSILEKRTVADKGIFALWAIRHVVGDAGKIVSGSSLVKFILEAFEFKTHGRTLENAFESNTAKGKVLKVEGGYQVQPPGIEYAKQMASLSKGASAASASSASATKK